jgi:drug/metabolite transporter (DMT)-like permease
VTLSRVEVLVAALLFSTGGAAIKAVSLSAWQVASFRAGIAAVTLLLLVPEARRVSRRALLVALAQAATFVTFVLANKLTTAASAVFLQATAPLWLIVLGPVLLGERSRRGDAPFVAVLFAGVLLLVLGTPEPSATAPDTALGNIVSVVSGLLWALTLAGLRWAGREGARGGTFTAPSATMWGNVMAFFVCLPLALPTAAVGTRDVMLIVYLGVVQVGLAYVFLTRGLARLPAIEASLLLLLEPASSPLWAWLVHREAPGGLAVLGGAIILGATTWRSVRGRAATVAPQI